MQKITILLGITLLSFTAFARQDKFVTVIAEGRNETIQKAAKDAQRGIIIKIAECVIDEYEQSTKDKIIQKLESAPGRSYVNYEILGKPVLNGGAYIIQIKGHVSLEKVRKTLEDIIPNDKCSTSQQNAEAIIEAYTHYRRLWRMDIIKDLNILQGHPLQQKIIK